MARSRELFWLVDLLLDVYLFCLVFGNLHEGVSGVSSSFVSLSSNDYRYLLQILGKHHKVVYALVAYIHTTLLRFMHIFIMYLFLRVSIFKRHICYLLSVIFYLLSHFILRKL